MRPNRVYRTSFGPAPRRDGGRSGNHEIRKALLVSLRLPARPRDRDIYRANCPAMRVGNGRGCRNVADKVFVLGVRISLPADLCDAVLDLTGLVYCRRRVRDQVRTREDDYVASLK